MVKMYSPAACVSCAMSRVGKSNHSAGTGAALFAPPCRSVCGIVAKRLIGCSWMLVRVKEFLGDSTLTAVC